MQDNHNILVQQYLSILYQKNKKEQVTLPKTQGKKTETHGEILFESMCEILSQLSLLPNDIFVDLGSGWGKTTTQVFLTSVVKESIGIEIQSNLHESALSIAHTLQTEIPDFFIGKRKLIFLEGDFLKLTPPNSTILFANSTCFTQQLLHQIGTLVDNLPHIHTVITTRPLCLSKRLRFRKAIPIQCSWDSALCYIYQA